MADALGPTRTESAPIFEKSAEDLVARLDRDGSEVARGMAREAQVLLDLFRGWGEQRPVAEVRIGAIQALFELNRRAMDYLSIPRASPGSPPGSRR